MIKGETEENTDVINHVLQYIGVPQAIQLTQPDTVRCGLHSLTWLKGLGFSSGSLCTTATVKYRDALGITHLFHQVVLGPQEVLGILVFLQAQALLLSQQLLGDQVVLVALADYGLNNNHSGFDSAFD